jgi:hypothetical protein
LARSLSLSFLLFRFLAISRSFSRLGITVSFHFVQLENNILLRVSRFGFKIDRDPRHEPVTRNS